VGYDNTKTETEFYSPLCTVDPGRVKLGQTAAEMLLAEMRGAVSKETAKRCAIEPVLITGTTVRQIRA
jgi:DNA-binding LacI/PurR family transcriptional regulator